MASYAGKHITTFMNKLTNERRIQVIAALVEGCSINATVRMTGVAKNTILNLLADIGEACANYQDKVMRDLPCRRLVVRRDLELLPFQEKECCARASRHLGLRRRLDLGCDRRG